MCVSRVPLNTIHKQRAFLSKHRNRLARIKICEAKKINTNISETKTKKNMYSTSSPPKAITSASLYWLFYNFHSDLPEVGK